jgi:hypothetical protein
MKEFSHIGIWGVLFIFLFIILIMVIYLIHYAIQETKKRKKDEGFSRVTYWRFINPKSRNQFRLKGFKNFGLDPVIYTPN